MSRRDSYDDFFSLLHRDLQQQHPEWRYRHPAGQNYALLGRPDGTPSFVEWHLDFASEHTDALRAQLYLGNDVQRRGWDPLSLLEERMEALADAYGRPERLRAERWATRGGAQAQRLAVYLPGSIEERNRHEEFQSWMIDRLAALRTAVDQLVPDLTRDWA